MSIFNTSGIFGAVNNTAMIGENWEISNEEPDLVFRKLEGSDWNEKSRVTES